MWVSLFYKEEETEEQKLIRQQKKIQEEEDRAEFFKDFAIDKTLWRDYLIRASKPVMEKSNTPVMRQREPTIVGMRYAWWV